MLTYFNMTLSEEGAEATSPEFKRTRDNPLYHAYCAMVARCTTGSSAQIKQPTYIGCTTTFKSFKDFEDWATLQVGCGLDGYQLDKDILLKGNKVYSKETCVFVPKFINTLLVKCDKVRGSCPVGVYCDNSCKKKKFKAQLRVKGKNISLGRFVDVESAFLAYKRAKENYIKTVADEYKDVIDSRVYQALLNYTVGVED